MKTPKNNTKASKTRKLTVSCKNRIQFGLSSFTYSPYLRLSGKWLFEIGFCSGQIVSVQRFDRKLIIEPISEPSV